MVTARRVGRWALYGLGGLVVLVVLVRVGVGIYLATPAGKAMVARQISSRIGMPVEVQSVRVGLLTSSISMRVFDPAAPDPSKAEVLAVESASADVSLFGILRGKFAPGEVELKGVNLVLHVSADGDVLTTMPKSSGGEGMATPAIKLTGGRITVRQDGRPEFALRNLDLQVETTPDGGAKLSGTIDDPEWSKWTVAGEVSGTSSSGSVELATPDGPLTMDRLSSIPFVPPAVWESVKADGRGAIKLRVWKGASAGSEVEYTVDITPAAAALTVPDASITLSKVTGLIRVTGAKVKLEGTKGELAGGTIAVDGDLDFGGEPTTVDLKVSAEGLDIRQLPPEWKLPKDFAGKLKGHANLALKFHDDGRFEADGGGQGAITDVKVLDFPADDIPIRLHRRGNRYEFEQMKAKAVGAREAPRQPVRCAAPRGKTRDECAGTGLRPGVAEMAAGLTSPLEGEVAASLWTRRVGGETLLPPQAPPPTRRRSAADLPLKGGGQGRGATDAIGWLPRATLSHPFGVKTEYLPILATQQPPQPQPPPKDDPPLKKDIPQPKKDDTQPRTDVLGPKPDETTTLDATIRLRDIEIAELLDKLQVKLGYKISGKITVEAAIAVPVAGALSATAYEFAGSVSSPALRFEGLTVREFSAKMEYKGGKLTLTDLSGKIDQPGKPGGTAATPGTFRGTATAAVDPPGDATASFAFDRIPLGEVLKAIPDFTLDVRGTVSGKVALKAPYEKLWDANLWSGSGELTSTELVVEGRTAKGLRVSAEVAKGQLALKDAGLTLEGIPVTAEGTFGLTDKFAFSATVRTTATDVTDLRKLVPEVEIPAPVEGVLETETKVTGTASPLAFTATGTITASKLTLGRSTANRVSVKWELTRDKLAVSELKADAFGGTLSGSADVPFDRDKAGKFEVAFKELDAAAATELVPDFPVRIAGKVSGKVGGAIPPAKPGEPRVGNLDVDLTAPKLTVQGIPAERLVGKGAIRGKSLEYQLEGKTLGGSFEIKGRYPGRKKDGMGMDDRGSFRLTGLDLSRVATDVGFRSLAPLRGRVDANFEFENDLSAGTGRLTITRLHWGRELIAEELTGLLSMQDGLLQLPEVTGRVAGGSLRARGRVFLTHTSRNFFSVSLDGADAKQLLAPFDLGTLLEGPVTVVVRGNLGTETRASGTITLPRGTASGVQVSDLRVPFEFATSPGGHGRLTIREAALNAGSGRVRAELTADWGYTTRVEGKIRFTEVPLRTISPALGEISLLGNGRITGRFDLDGRNMRSIDDLGGTLIATLNNTSVKEIPVLAQTTRFLNPSGLVKPFNAGDVRATLSGGVFRVERLALANPAAQLFAEGTITTSGRVDLDVVAHTGAIGPDVRGLRAFGLRVPAIGPLPVALIRDVSDFLSNRTILMTITGTTSNPIVRVNVGRLLTDQAVRFFLSRYVVPAEAAGVLGLGASVGSMEQKK